MYAGDPTLSAHCDITLVVQGRRYQAHRAILSAVSPVFHRMLSLGEAGEDRFGRLRVSESSREKNIIKEITLDDDVAADSWHKVLEFIYTGSLKICCHHMCISLLKPAQKFLIESLLEKIERYLVRYTPAEHYLNSYRLSDMLGLWSSRNFFKSQIVQNFHSYSHHDNFPKLEIRLIEELVDHAAHNLDPHSFQNTIIPVIAKWLIPNIPVQRPPPRNTPCEHCRRNPLQDEHHVGWHEQVRHHFEDRLYRLVDLRQFNTDVLYQVLQLARECDFDYLFRNAQQELYRRNSLIP